MDRPFLNLQVGIVQYQALLRWLVDYSCGLSPLCVTACMYTRGGLPVRGCTPRIAVFVRFLWVYVSLAVQPGWHHST
jgi:hypothetical protein